MFSTWRAFGRSVTLFNVVCGYLSAGLIVASSVILCYEVAMRYYFAAPTSWVLEACIFMLVAATFMSAGYTQLKRAHVAINVLDSVLSPRVNAWRYLVGDLISLVFCAVVAIMAWKHWHVAWDQGWTAPTLWAPKMWIPYFFIAVGMTALCLQQVIQLVDERIRCVCRRA